MARALLGLGSNLGSSRDNFAQAVGQLISACDIRLLTRSRWHRTKPIGGPSGQGEFLNGCILVQTAMEPEDLVLAIHHVEQQMGRSREVHWGPREIDIDLLLYDQRVFHSPELVIPHPRMSFRRFVLEPAAEIASQAVHPASGWTISGLLRHLCRWPRIVGFFANDADRAQQLAAEICRRIGCHFVEDPGDLSCFFSSESSQQPQTNRPLVYSSPLESTLPRQVCPGLALIWATTEIDSEASPEKVLDRMHWRGPTALLTGKDLDDVAEEAVFAIRAAWPDSN